VTGHALQYHRVEAREATVAELVVAVQRGNRDAFGTLYQRFHRIVHAIALAHLRVGDAADVVQDVFAEVWMKIESVREPAAFPGWIVTIARRRSIDHLRKRGPATSDAVADIAIDPPPRVEAIAALQAIRALPETYRETLIMRLVEGLTGPEIAERTGMTPDSVRVHLHRGMKLLRDKLEDGSP
jgi:RNA polymerase sigma-70 factor (ECF subfamily)